MTAFSLRLLAYLLLIAGVFQLAALAMDRWGWEAVLREDGLIESAEVGVLALAGLLAAALVWREPRTRSLYGVLAVGLWLVVFRELDNSAAYQVLSSAAKFTIVIVLIGGLVLLDHRGFVASARELLDRPQAVFFILGIVFVFLWAQLLGQPALWRPLYVDYGRGRRVVEESLELAGHLLILFGVIEEHVRLGWRSRRPRC